MKKIRIYIVTVAVMIFWIFIFQAAAVSIKSMDYGSADSFVKIHGIISQEYYDFEKDGFNNGVNSYDNHETFLFIECMIRQGLTSILEFRVNHGVGRLMIDQCLIDYKIKKSLGFKFGKFYLETYLGSKIHRPTTNKLVSEVFPVAGFYDPILFRNIGVGLYGEKDLNERMKLSYNFTLTNGSMISDAKLDEENNLSFNETTRDIDRHKAVSGMLSISPHKNIKFSGGIYNSKANLKMIVTSLFATGVSGVDTIITTRMDMGKTDFRTKSYWIEWNKNRVNIYVAGLFTEYVSGSGLKVIASGSYIGEISCRIMEDSYVNYLDLISRIIHYDVDLRGSYATNYSDIENVMYVFGINVSPVRHFKLKVEYQIINEIDNSKLENNGVMLQAVVDF